MVCFLNFQQFPEFSAIFRIFSNFLPVILKQYLFLLIKKRTAMKINNIIVRVNIIINNSTSKALISSLIYHKYFTLILPSNIYYLSQCPSVLLAQLLESYILSNAGTNRTVRYFCIISIKFKILFIYYSLQIYYIYLFSRRENESEEYQQIARSSKPLQKRILVFEFRLRTFSKNSPFTSFLSLLLKDFLLALPIIIICLF